MTRVSIGMSARHSEAFVAPAQHTSEHAKWCYVHVMLFSIKDLTACDEQVAYTLAVTVNPQRANAVHCRLGRTKCCARKLSPLRVLTRL